MKEMRQIAWRLLVALGLMAFVACGSSENETAGEDSDQQFARLEESGESQETDQGINETIEGQEVVPDPEEVREPEPEPEPKAEAKPKPKPTPKPKPKPVEEAPPAPEPVFVAVPAGSVLPVLLDTKLRTDSNSVGDPVVATLSTAIMANGETAIPAGSKLHGRLADVEEPHRTKGKARMTLRFDQVETPDGQSYVITTEPLMFEAEGDEISDEAKVGAGSVIGGAIGALASKKKGKGALIGAAAGAAAGGAIALATKGKQLELTPGQQLNVKMTETASIEVKK